MSDAKRGGIDGGQTSSIMQTPSYSRVLLKKVTSERQTNNRADNRAGDAGACSLLPHIDTHTHTHTMGSMGHGGSLLDEVFGVSAKNKALVSPQRPQPVAPAAAAAVNDEDDSDSDDAFALPPTPCASGAVAGNSSASPGMWTGCSLSWGVDGQGGSEAQSASPGREAFKRALKFKTIIVYLSPN